MLKKLGHGLPEVKARGGRRMPGDPYKSELERQYAQRLQLLLHAGQIRAWRYEGHRLEVAAGAWYTPDFTVILCDGTLEFHECKGFWREAAKVRMKVVVERHPFFQFVIITRQGSGFARENL